MAEEGTRGGLRRNDILAQRLQASLPGWWYASPATDVGCELIGAGMLILDGGAQGKNRDGGQDGHGED
jgi:hypothetical protein